MENNVEYSDILKEIETPKQAYDETIIHDLMTKIHTQEEYPVGTCCFWCCHSFAGGYLEYKNSSLYKEIIETRTATDTEKKVKKEAKLKLKTEMPTINPTNDIEELREELSFLKKELKRCYALYGFESH